MNRRKFLLRAAGLTVGSTTAAAAYGRIEAGCLRVVRQSVAVPRLPAAFHGLTVGLLTDPHHGPFNSLQLIQEAVITVPRALIAETIDLIAVLTGRGSQRRLVELATVKGLNATGDYMLAPATDLTTIGDHV